MKNLLKRLLSVVCVISLCVSIAVIPTSASGDEIKVLLDGRELSFDVPPQIIDGRTMLPVRAVFESMGAEVIWDSNSNTVIAQTDDRKITMTVGEKKYGYWFTKGAQREYIYKDMDIAMVNINGRTLAPLRVVANCLNYSVNWYDETKTAYIETPSTKSVNGFYVGTVCPSFDNVANPIMGNSVEAYPWGTLVYTYGYLNNFKSTLEQDSLKYIEYLKSLGWNQTEKKIVYDYETKYTFQKDNNTINVTLNYDQQFNKKFTYYSYYIKISTQNNK